MNVTTQPQTYTDLKNKNFVIKLIVLFAVIPTKVGMTRVSNSTYNREFQVEKKIFSETKE
jgi:hypothetical protein